MPTNELEDQFRADYAKLSREARRAFRVAVDKFKNDLDRDGRFRASLRVRPMAGHPGVFEMTWEGNDGRATFSYGAEVIAGKRHIIWRRVGSHEIYENP
jgi:hypothetical protein